MRFRAPLSLLSIAFALTACGGGQSGFTNPPLNTQAARRQLPAVSNASASTQGVSTNISVPIQLTVFIPCANGGSGDTITLSGNLHELISFTITANNIHLNELVNPQGISGVSSLTGQKYQGTGETRQDANIANAGFPAEATFVNNFKIIGQSTGNNYLVHENAHITINANGTVTATQDNLSITCK